MKKIFLIQLIVILSFACSSDEDTSPYYNPVEGEWNVYNDDGKLLHTRVYTSDFYAYFSVIDGNIQHQFAPLHYDISGDQLIFDRYTQKYLIKNDTLWITNSRGDQTTKYIRNTKSI